MKSVMKHQFSQVPKANIPRSTFDRSHGYKTTFDSGLLIPIYCDEALPGDTFNMRMAGFARLATPIAPFMDNLKFDTQYFAVPIRLIWENWPKMNGEQDNPGDSTDYIIPTMTPPAGGYEENSIHDYMGIPPGIENLEHSALFHRAYNLIYNEWYRDQNLQDSITVNKGDGPDDPADYELKRRGKRHDYFTSALPFPQKGESIELPLGAQAPITGIGAISTTTFNPSVSPKLETGGIDNTDWVNTGITDLNDNWFIREDEENPGYPAIYANLEDATAATINQLRQAFQVQKLLERDARGGTRYIEVVKSHFGVTSPDSRLQRPEYLGGGSTPIYINPIAQTSATDPSGPDASPQGNLAAIGTATMAGHAFTKSFTEHCVIIGLASVRADLTYQQGLNRMFSRSTRFDFYWPVLSHIGEQAVLNKEIFAQGTEEDEEVFGYQERYAEYRYKPSQITGRFRSDSDATLDWWHLSQDFESLPELGPSFIEENPPVERVVAVNTEPQFLLDCYFSLKCARPMPLYGVPGLIDHF